ncbi:MAG: hemolysin family protein, partial [Planctomycetota bacterium]
KLHRVGVSLAIAMHLLRVLWVVDFVLLRLQYGAWYAPGAWVTANGSAITFSVSLWTGTGFVLELLILGVFFQELLPQVFTTWKGRQITHSSFPVLNHVEKAFSPLARGFRAFRRALLRFVGNGQEPSEAARAEEVIRAAVEAGEREGVLLAGEKSMIESMLKFHDVEVTEVMTPRTDIACFEASLTIDDVIPKAIACGHSRIPVYRKDIDDIVGVLYVKDLLRYVGDEQQCRMPVEKAVRKVNFVPESKKIGELLAEFRAERFHIAVILDEYGGTSGLVTIEDILEEIVGEIEDEYDAAEMVVIKRIGSGTFDLDGRAHVDEVSKALGISLPESNDYDTIAGFVLGSLGRVPKEGEEFQHDSLRFRITQADERKIKKIRVQILAPLKQDLD